MIILAFSTFSTCCLMLFQCPTGEKSFAADECRQADIKNYRSFVSRKPPGYHAILNNREHLELSRVLTRTQLWQRKSCLSILHLPKGNIHHSCFSIQTKFCQGFSVWYLCFTRNTSWAAQLFNNCSFSNKWLDLKWIFANFALKTPVS